MNRRPDYLLFVQSNNEQFIHRRDRYPLSGENPNLSSHAVLNKPELLEEGPMDLLIVRDGNRVVKVQCNDILYIQPNRYYIIYYLASGSRLEEYKTLKDVEELLDGGLLAYTQFVYCQFIACA